MAIHKARKYEDVRDTVKDGDTVYIIGVWSFPEPVYIFPDVNNLTIIDGVLDNVILDPDNYTTVERLSGETVTFPPAVWCKTWTRDTGLGRCAKGKFSVYFAEDREELQRQEEERQRIAEKRETVIELVKELDPILKEKPEELQAMQIALASVLDPEQVERLAAKVGRI